MPPKRKTQKANGFMMFMIEMRPRLEADGHNFPGGLMDVHPVCTPLWNVRLLEIILFPKSVMCPCFFFRI